LHRLPVAIQQAVVSTQVAGVLRSFFTRVLTWTMAAFLATRGEVTKVPQ
jgi:hypothetical protein